MAFLSEISDYKNTIIERLLSDQELCKALYYQTPDFLEQPDIEDASELIYNNIYPHRFIPTIDQTMWTYVTMALGDFRLIKRSFKVGTIAINVFTHRTTFKTDYGCTRVDYIVNKIDEMMNEQRGTGVGKLEFDYLKEYVVNENFQGYCIAYRSVDFNR